MKIVLIMTAFFCCQTIQAQEFKVIKKSRGKLLIQSDRPEMFLKGETYRVEGTSTSKSTSPRKNFFGISSNAGGTPNVSSFNIKASGDFKDSSSATRFDVRGIYGWNEQTMEYGPILGFYQLGGSSTSETYFNFGGFFDYNVLPNKPGTTLVYGATGAFEYTMSENKVSEGNSSSTTSYTLPIFGVGGQMKFFPAGHNFAFRMDALFRMGTRDVKINSNTDFQYKLSESGLYIFLGFFGYI